MTQCGSTSGQRQENEPAKIYSGNLQRPKMKSLFCVEVVPIQRRLRCHDDGYGNPQRDTTGQKQVQVVNEQPHASGQCEQSDPKQ